MSKVIETLTYPVRHPINFSTNWVVNTAGFLVYTNPLYSILENPVLGQSDMDSKDTRISASVMAATVLAPAFKLGLDLSNRGLDFIFNRNKDPDFKRLQKIRDFSYSTLFGLGFSYLLYGGYTPFSSQNYTGEEILLGTAFGGLISGPMGLVGTYGIQTMRELTGLSTDPMRPSVLPESYKRRSRTFRLGVAGTLLAASIAWMSNIYNATPEGFKGVKGYVEDHVSQHFDNGNNNNLEGKVE
jgi:hypothetical protein